MPFIFACKKGNSTDKSTSDSTQRTVKPPIDSAASIYLAGGRTDSVIAVDAVTGKVKWEKAINSIAGFSPIYSKGFIIVSGTGSDFSVYGFDTSGNMKWTYLMSNSATCAPVTEDGRVFISDGGSVYALDAQTGSLLWRFTDGGCSQLAVRNNTLYFSTNTYYIEALDAQNGKKDWEYKCITAAYPPVAFDDRIYCEAGNMLVLDSKTGQLINDSKGNNGIYEGTVTYNVRYGNIYVLRNSQTTGVWVTDSVEPSTFKFSLYYPTVYDPPSTAPILEDSMVILPFGINNAITGELLEPNFLWGTGTLSVTYLNGILYCLTDQRDTYDPNLGGHEHADLYAWDLRENKKLWQTEFLNGYFINIEACIVTKSKICHRGALKFE